MARFDWLIASVRSLAAQQAVMLDVVCLRQRIPADKVMGQNERCNFPTEQYDQGSRYHEGQRKPLQDFVFERPKGFAPTRESLGFVAPAALEGSRQFSHGQAVDGFPEPRACRIFRRRHPCVVAAVMLDTKMCVADDVVGEQGEYFVDPIRLVAKLVPDEQRSAVDRADAESQNNISPPRQILC